CEIKGDRDAAHAVGREPLFCEPHVRTKRKAASFEFAVQPLDARFQLRAFDAHIQIAQPRIQQILIAQRLPIACRTALHRITRGTSATHTASTSRGATKRCSRSRRNPASYSGRLKMINAVTSKTPVRIARSDRHAQMNRSA